MNFLDLLKKFMPQILSFLQGQAAKQMDASDAIKPIEVATSAAPILDWSNPASKVSEYFTVRECLWLPTWKRMANEEDGLNDSVKSNLITLCKTMDKIRDVLGQPIAVHCMYRPGPYSKLVGGSETDVHTLGQAIDFDCNPHMTCDEVKTKLLPLLEQYGLRMEDNGVGSGWVHLDTHPVGHARFFKA